MSILVKPYEISIWEDVWHQELNEGEGAFVEERLCVIGSDRMEAPSRVIKPKLVRNINGTKTLTFEMYKKYLDTTTGLLVDNPYISLLQSERKVKLLYNNSWYDFLIKNISESSRSHLCTYSLEDANVNELSKNGFDFIFDNDLSNNFGTLPELATKVMLGTDWEVESEAIVQKIEEPVVHLILNSDIKAYWILDQQKFIDETPEEKPY